METSPFAVEDVYTELVIDVFYIFNSTVIDWTCYIFFESCFVSGITALLCWTRHWYVDCGFNNWQTFGSLRYLALNCKVGCDQWNGRNVRKGSIVADIDSRRTVTSNSSRYTVNRTLVGPRTHLDAFIGTRTMVSLIDIPGVVSLLRSVCVYWQYILQQSFLIFPPISCIDCGRVNERYVVQWCRELYFGPG